MYSTLLLPSMAALAMVIVGLDPQDYSWNTCFLQGQETMNSFQAFSSKIFNGDCWSIAFTSGIVRSMLFVIPMLAVSVAVGWWWGGNRWIVAAAIFHVTFGLLFTSFFTNMGGWATGTLGSLGYWLAQQEVARGSQPWYYYGIVVPLYEFLPLIFTFLATRLWLKRQQMHKVFSYWFWVVVTAVLFGSYIYYASNRSVVELGMEPSSTAAILAGLGLFVLGGAAWFFYLWPRIKRQENISSFWRLSKREDWVGFVPGLIYWFLLTIAAYSYAGEKMPWLSIHFVIPMAFLVGWYFNEVLKETRWEDVFNRRTLLQIGLTTIVILTVWLAITPVLLGEVSLGLQTTTNLEGLGLLIGRILLAGGAIYLLREVTRQQGGVFQRRAWLLSIFGLLSLMTIRFSYMANIPNADYVNEFLVYAHGAPATKEDVMPQIEELSMRLNGDKGIEIWYDEPWPYTWYLRDYPNKRYFNDASPDLANAPIILSRNDNWGKIDPVLRNNYDMQTYTYLWWPMEEYRQLGWESFLGNPDVEEAAIPSGLMNAQVRSALWDIFWHRDFTVYGNIFNRDFSPSRWPLRKELRLYIRKDVKAQLWDRGVGATAVVLPEDPYADGALTYNPAQVIGTIGTGDGQFQTPRNIAVGPDDRLYVADSGNHRIQVLENDGTFVTSFGSFGAGVANFNEPWGIAVDEAFVYVADTWNHRVQKFTLDGEFVTAFGQSGNVTDVQTGPGSFFGPRDVILLPENQLAVTDTGNHRIQIFDRDGNFVSASGGFGSNQGQFFEPVGMAVNADGSIYLADTWNARVQELYGPALAPVNAWPIEGWYSQTTENKPYVALDSEGRVYVTDPEGFRVLVFGRSGTYVGRFGNFGSGLDGFGLPNGLSLDSADNIYVADAVNGVVIKFPPLDEMSVAAEE